MRTLTLRMAGSIAILVPQGTAEGDTLREVEILIFGGQHKPMLAFPLRLMTITNDTDRSQNWVRDECLYLTPSGEEMVMLDIRDCAISTEGVGVKIGNLSNVLDLSEVMALKNVATPTVATLDRQQCSATFVAKDGTLAQGHLARYVATGYVAAVNPRLNMQTASDFTLVLEGDQPTVVIEHKPSGQTYSLSFDIDPAEGPPVADAFVTSLCGWRGAPSAGAGTELDFDGAKSLFPAHVFEPITFATMQQHGGAEPCLFVKVTTA